MLITSPVSQAVMQGLFGLTLFIAIPGLILLVVRRKIFPIKGSGPFFLVFGCHFMVPLNGASAVFLSIYPLQLPCIYDVLFLNCSLVLIFCLFEIRSCLLIIKHFVAEKKFDMTMSKNSLYSPTDFGTDFNNNSSLVYPKQHDDVQLHEQIQQQQNGEQADNADIANEAQTLTLMPDNSHERKSELLSNTIEKEVSIINSSNTKTKNNASKTNCCACIKFKHRCIELLSNNRILTFLFSIALLLKMLPFIILGSMVINKRYGDCTTANLANTILLAFKIFYVLFSFMCLAIIFRKRIDDVFNLSRELAVTSIILICTTLLRSFLLIYVDFKINFSLSMIFVVAGRLILFTIGCLHPIYETYVESNRIKKLSQERKYTNLIRLKELLRTPQGVEEFKRHMVSEFAVENLLFYLHVSKIYQKRFSQNDSKLAEFIQQTFDTYIKEGSKYQINISYSTLMDIKTNIQEENQSQNIFVKAQKEILKLMANDSFPRYRKKYMKSRRSFDYQGSVIKTSSQSKPKTSLSKSYNSAV